VLERPRHSDPGTLVSMDAADHEHARPLRVTGPQRDDRPALLRAAEQQGACAPKRARGFELCDEALFAQPAPPRVTAAATMLMRTFFSSVPLSKAASVGPS
jgi:hypothetical protein